MRRKLAFSKKAPGSAGSQQLQLCQVIDLTGQQQQEKKGQDLSSQLQQEKKGGDLSGQQQQEKREQPQPTEIVECDSLWTTEFAPTEESQLVIARDRLSSIREWLEYLQCNTSRQQDSNGCPICKILFLQGPTGCGKSSCVRVLGRDCGFSVHEWTNKTQDDYEDSHFLVDKYGGRQTNLDRFEYFIKKLRFKKTIKNTDIKPRLIFISEIPFAWSREQQERLIKILIILIIESKFPIIIKITEYYSDNNELGNNFQSRNLPKLIEEKLSMHGYPPPRIINLNQITESGIKKVIQRIIEAKKMLNLSKDEINSIVRNSDRDLCYAINSLQMYINDGKIREKSCQQNQKGQKRKREKEKNIQPKKKQTKQTKKLMENLSFGEFSTQENILNQQNNCNFQPQNNNEIKIVGQQQQQQQFSLQNLSSQSGENPVSNQNSQNQTQLQQNGTQQQKQFQNLQLSTQSQQKQQKNQEIDENPISKLIKPHDKGTNLILGLGKIVYQKEDAWNDLDGLLSKMDTKTETLVTWLEEKMFERFGNSNSDDELRWEKFEESVQILNQFISALQISSGSFNSRGSLDGFCDENSKQVVLGERIGSSVAALGFMCNLKHEGKRHFQPNRRPKILGLEQQKQDSKIQMKDFRSSYLEIGGELLSHEEISTYFDVFQWQQSYNSQKQEAQIEEIEDEV